MSAENHNRQQAEAVEQKGMWFVDTEVMSFVAHILHHLPYVLGVNLQDLMFAHLGISLVCVRFLSITVLHPFRLRIFNHCVLKVFFLFSFFLNRN